MLGKVVRHATVCGLRSRTIDLRSDTVTQPSIGQRLAMADCAVGDDIRGEDPSVNALQDRMAKLLGKEGALFMPSGTMANLVAIGAHCNRGEAALVGELSHVYCWEAHGASSLLGVPLLPIPNTPNGALDMKVLSERVLEADDPHIPPVGLVLLENTHNMCGGQVVPLSHVNMVADLCHRQGVKLHIDGARIFNAAAALNCEVHELVGVADSVQVCLSKAIGAPVGSILAGNAEFLHRALRLRKAAGGAMRQSGVLAAAAAMQALDEQLPQLAQDHHNAKTLAQGLAAIPGLWVDLAAVQTNIVHFSVKDDAPVDADGLITSLKTHGILLDRTYSTVGGELRAVFHKDVTNADVVETLDRITTIMGYGSGANVAQSATSSAESAGGPRTTPVAVEWDGARLHVTWGDGHRSSFLHIWLRDHCPDSMHSKTLQRNIDSLDIPLSTCPVAVVCSADRIVIDWDSSIPLSGSTTSISQSVFSTQFLRDHCYSAEAQNERHEALPKPVLWGSDPSMSGIPRLQYCKLQENARRFMKEMLATLQAYGAVVITGTPPNSDGLNDVGMRVGHWLSTIWGPAVWTLSNKTEADPDGYIPDTAYTNIQLRPHVDGCYMEAVPGIQMFLCLQPSTSGGATWLLDGFSVAEELRQKCPRAFAFFRSVPLPFQSITDTDHVYAFHTVIKTNQMGDVVAFQYNNDDRAPLSDLPAAVIEEFYEHLPGLLQLLRSPKYSQEVRLEKGDLLIVNNQRVLHGRRSFKGSREFIGGYISRDQLHSACRQHGVPILY